MDDISYSRISYYIVAHADDWQLFMQPNVYQDLGDTKCKVVFIITTAGDAGSSEQYWRSREEGTKSSVRFFLASFQRVEELNDLKEIDGRLVNYSSINNSVTYFLRLPDGNLDGTGFTSYKNHSLTKLRTATIPTVTAVDNSNIFSWNELCSVLRSVIQLESEGIADIDINYLNPDLSKNPSDHADHIATGEAVKQATVGLPIKHLLFVGYSIADRNNTIEADHLFWKAGMFAAYEKAVYDGSGYSTLQEGVSTYLKWLVSNPSYITISKEE